MTIPAFIAGCKTEEVNVNEEDEIKTEYHDDVKTLTILIDKTEEDIPSDLETIDIPGTDYAIDVDRLNYIVDVYETFEKKDINLTPEDIIELWSSPMGERKNTFDQLFRWWITAGASDEKSYMFFVRRANDLYKSKNGKRLIEKDDIREFTSSDMRKVVEWGIENIDYELIDEIVEREKEQAGETYDFFYYRFLYEIGLVTKDGKPVE